MIRATTAAAIAAVAMMTVIVATGRVLAVAVDARADRQSLVGMTRQPGLAWFALPDHGMVPLSSAGARTPHAGALDPVEGSRLAMVVASGTLPDVSDDTIFTGSIGTSTGRFDLPRAEPSIRFENAMLQHQALPLPRLRPQLAALPPVGGIGIPPDEDAPPSKTAIYDITAKIVYMPNGERLEAHSGFGEYMDDPRHVRLRMRGVTPPNTYKLTMREALFHGVEAIRMTPENKDAMFGRAGILAHPYLLGPNGQSHGCVSLKDYPKFLAAFKRGEVERMIVVERLKQAPSFLARRSLNGAGSML